MLASWRENVFLIIGSSLPSIVVSTMKSAIHRSIDAKKEFQRSRWSFNYTISMTTHRENIVLDWRRNKNREPPTISRRETCLDEARLQPHTALIEPIGISPMLFQADRSSLNSCGSVLSPGDGVALYARDKLSSSTVYATRTYRNHVIDGTVCGLEPLAIVMQINSPARAATGAQINSVFKWRLCVDCLCHRSESLRLYNRG